jgi:adenylate cyclase
VQTIALLVAWTHACIGLYFWLRLKRWFPRAAPALFATAILLPTLALLGYYQGGRAVIALSAVPEWRVENLSPGQLGTPEQNARLADIREKILYGWAGAIVSSSSPAAYARLPSAAAASCASPIPTAARCAFRSA